MSKPFLGKKKETYHQIKLSPAELAQRMIKVNLVLVVRSQFIEAVLTSTHNLCFEQKYEKYQNFSSENFHFLVVKFSVYLNRRVSVMIV